MEKVVVVCLAIFVLSGSHALWAGMGCPMRQQGYWYENESDHTTPHSRYSWRNMSPKWMSFDYDELTSQQRKELRALNKKFEKKGYRARKNLQALRLEFQALKLKDEADQKIEAKQAEIEKIETKLEKLSEEYRTEVKKILPEELADEYLYDESDHWYGYWRHCPMWQ